MSTFIDERVPRAAHPSRSGLARAEALSRRRLVLLEDNSDMAELLRDLLDHEYDLILLPRRAQLPSIDGEEPDVILVGTAASDSSSALNPAELAALSARHMRLHQVPMVVLTPDGDALRDARRMAGIISVTVVPLPFDADTIRCVLNSVLRPTGTQRRMRLPELCPHGFDVSADRCSRCAATTGQSKV